MGKLYVAANTVAFGVGHLQIVYEHDNGFLEEIEVQAPSNAGVTGGDWSFEGGDPQNPRAHYGDNTPGTDADDGVTNDDGYSITEIQPHEGQTVNQLWQLLL